MPDPTNTPTPAARPVPEWVHDLRRASIWGDEYMPAAERALLDAVGLLLRARTGRTKLEDPKRVAKLFITDALTALDGQARS